MTKAKGTDPPPRAPRVGALSKLPHVRAELASVYRDGRQGRIRTQEMSRLVYALGVLAKVIEIEKYDHRMREIEKRLGLK